MRYSNVQMAEIQIEVHQLCLIQVSHTCKIVMRLISKSPKPLTKSLAQRKERWKIKDRYKA